MIKAILNFPNPTKSIHQNENCRFYPNTNKNDGYRSRFVDINNISEIIQLIETIEFKSEPSYNTLHLEINFNNNEFENAFFKYLCILIGNRYPRFNNIEISTHCH